MLIWGVGEGNTTPLSWAFLQWELGCHKSEAPELDGWTNEHQH